MSLLLLVIADDDCVMKDELLNQIARKKQFIREYMGEEKGIELINLIQESPEEYIADSQPKCVKELSQLILQIESRDISTGDLHRLIKKLENKLDGIINKDDKCNDRGWKNVGQLQDLETLWDTYDPLEYSYGVLYNSPRGIPKEVVFSTWNQGIRMTTIHSYPMGDDSTKLKFGRTVFTKGLADVSDKENWYHHYYYLDNDERFHTNGNANQIKIYVKPIC